MTTTAKKQPQDRRPAKKTAAKKAPAKKGTPVQPEAIEVSDVSAFKTRKKGRVLPLPSGLAVRAQRVDLQTFLKQGNVPNPLMELISESIEKGAKADVQSMVQGEDGKIDIDTVNEMYDMVNTVVCATVIEPKINPIPMAVESDEAPKGVEYVLGGDEGTIVPVEDREDIEELQGRVFIDEVDEEDKMFLFQWAIGGTDDLATFRKEAGASLAALSQG